MADNTRLPLGTEDGDVYASDDIGGVKFQRVKLVLGANNANDGDVSSSNPVPVSGTVTASGPLTDAQLRAAPVEVDASGATVDVNIVSGSSSGTEYTEGDTDASITGTAILWEDGSDTLRAVSAAKPLPVGDAGGTLSVDDGGASLSVDGPLTDTELRATPIEVDGSGVTQPVSGTFWQATQPVSIAATVPTKETRSATGTTSQVADNAASVTLLSSNANRLGASITNDSSARLYIKTGTTASATDYTVSLAQYSHWEVPFGYTGRIDGIWASDPGDGAARITEYT